MEKLSPKESVQGGDTAHLCFKQAQTKMCHSPKVDDGVNDFLLFLLEHIFLEFFF